MPVIHRDRGVARKYTDADIARMQEMRKTMSLAKVGAAFGVSCSVIQKQLDEHGAPTAGVYRPRVLRMWPRGTDFRNDNLAVRD